jgi:ribosomal protein RSM22 (predicted rRNA methylase)
MQLPTHLAEKIENLLQKAPASILRKAQEALSRTYRQQGSSRSIFQDEAQSLAYLAARLPATYAAVSQVLQKLELPIPCHHWLDLGSGPGTASLAAIHALPLQKITLIERSKEAIALGKQLGDNHSVFREAEWLCRSLPCPLPRADVAIASYVLGELEAPLELVEAWWKSEIPIFIVVEPGTPRGFQLIKKIRTQCLLKGSYLLAPCPHSFDCPMKEGDWCHFSARIERSRLHRYLKEGTLGYEDEKYSYLVLSRVDFLSQKQARILRHPQKNSGHVRLALCDVDGQRKEKVVTRSNKEFYRKIRDAEWGDPFCKAALQED